MMAGNCWLILKCLKCRHKDKSFKHLPSCHVPLVHYYLIIGKGQWQGGEQGVVKGLSPLDSRQLEHGPENTTLPKEAERSWHAYPVV